MNGDPAGRMSERGRKVPPVPSHRSPTHTVKAYCLDTNLRGENPYICINFPPQVLIEERIWRHRGNKCLPHPFESHMASLEITLVPR